MGPYPGGPMPAFPFDDQCPIPDDEFGTEDDEDEDD
jgi:hypothetical protein